MKCRHLLAKCGWNGNNWNVFSFSLLVFVFKMKVNVLSVFRILNNIILMNRTDKKILVHQEVECKAAVLFRYHWVALKWWLLKSEFSPKIHQNCLKIVFSFLSSASVTQIYMLDFNTLILSRNLCQHFLMFVGSLDGISSFVLHFFLIFCSTWLR